jgi:UrcA family protein
MKNLTTIVATTIIGACGLYSSAQADTLLEPPAVTVHFEDLNIDNARGAATLYKRIQAAAAVVCREFGTTRSMVLFGRYAGCMHSAVGVAVARVNRPRVTEYAAAHGVAPADISMPIKTKFARNN